MYLPQAVSAKSTFTSSSRFLAFSKGLAFGGLLSFNLLCLNSVSLVYSQESIWETPEGRTRIFDAVVNVFEDNYWNQDYRDWGAWAGEYREAALAAPNRSEFDSAMRRMVSSLEDDHSSWLGQVAERSEAVVTTPPVNDERGLGVQHSYLPSTGIVIERVFPNTPASLAGLQRGDVIVKVGNEDVREANTYQISAILSSSVKQAEVSLEVRRKSQRFDIRLTPDVIQFSEVRDAPEARMLDSTTGYIYLPTFLREGIAQEVHSLIAALQTQGATTLVLDLRGNPGGRLDELGLVLGAFIEGEWAAATRHNEVVWRSSYTLRNGQGRGSLYTPDGGLVGEYTLDEPVQFSGPLAILVNQDNSSAGEVAALVLQNLGRATIIGEKTLGNVEAIQDFSLPDGSVIMIAVANLEGIDGTAFTNGVTPNVEVSENLQELARGFDAPLAEAVKAVKALPFTPGKYF
ncbi:MAG: S41 family peptidase [Trueperaceae bacterium]